jgi:hypothetical protein
MPLERPRYILTPGFICWRLYEPDTRAVLASFHAPQSWVASPEVVTLLTVTAFAGLADLKSPKAGRLSPAQREQLESETSLMASLMAENNNVVIAVLGRLRTRMERKAANPAGAFSVAFYLCQRPDLLAEKSEAIAMQVARATGVKTVTVDAVKKAIALLLKAGAVMKAGAQFRGDFGPPGMKLEAGQSYQFDGSTGLPVVKLSSVPKRPRRRHP